MNEAAEEALQRARAHLRYATLEGVEAARALLEVAIHGSGLGDPSDESLIAGMQRSLEEIVQGLRSNAAFKLPNALAEPLEAALAAEIQRWEIRSESDPDARPVLRAFLGLRELLWEIGLRRDREPAHAAPSGPARPGSARDAPNDDAPPPERPRAGRARVQRFDVED